MDKFVKLLTLAGSDNDAEALAAVRAARGSSKSLKWTGTIWPWC